MSINVLDQNQTTESLDSVADSVDRIYNSEVKSDTEEYFEYLEIDGQQYRRKMTKRIVVEKIKCQQTVFAPLMSDGSGPDLTRIVDQDSTERSNCTEGPKELTNDTETMTDPVITNAFKRFTEDRFRVSGSKFFPRNDNFKKLTMPINFDSQIDKVPSLMANYMYRFGQSDFEVPTIDSQLSTRLQDAMNSEWIETQVTNLPYEKSKTISYIKKSSQMNEDGKTVYNLFEKTKSRILRTKVHDSKKSIEACPPNETIIVAEVGVKDVKDNEYIDSSENIHHCKRDLDPFNDAAFEIPSPPSDYSLNSDTYTDTQHAKNNSPKVTSLYIPNDEKYSFILRETNARPYLIFDDDAKPEECDIAGGPVDALIVHACDGKEHLLFLAAFLDTYRTFIEPEDLICRLICRYKYFRSKVSIDCEPLGFSFAKNGNEMTSTKAGSPDEDCEKKCIHVLSLLLTIIGKLKKDFNEEIRNRINSFEEYLLEVNETQWIHTINNTIKSLQESVENDNEMVQHLYELSSPTTSQSNGKRSSKGRNDVLGLKSTILDFPSREIAEQMTLLDWAKYRDVELIEVLNLKDIAKCTLPGVIEYAKHFQNVQYWTQTILLDPDKRTSDRDKFCAKFHKIMKHLRELNNFASYIAILLGIQLLPIKKLFSKRIRAKISEMEGYMKPTKFIGYKEDLKHATAPCIPFLGLFYQDIVMLNIANPQYLDLDEVAGATTDSNWSSNNNHLLLLSITDQCGPVINFWRSFKQYIFLKNCNKDQDKIRYTIKPNEKILKCLNNFQDRLDDPTIQKLSKEA